MQLHVEKTDFLDTNIDTDMDMDIDEDIDLKRAPE
jgi:hypothetical protein